MTAEQLESRKYIIDYLTEEERQDTIIRTAITSLQGLVNSSYHACQSPTDIGSVFDEINDPNISVIIHFLSHGGDFGISKSTSQYYLEVIHWELLLKSLEKVKANCKSLSVNLMAVCSSHKVVTFDKRPYDYIWTVDNVTNSIATSQLIYSLRNFNSIVADLDNHQMFHENVGAN